jgi:uncharacterized membrane protein YhaH (DUF805 family)
MTEDLAARRTAKTFLLMWFSFSGRMSPREYLKKYVFLLCVSVAMASVAFFFLQTGALDDSIVITSFSFFIFVTTVIFSVSLVSLIARRLHDFDRRAVGHRAIHFAVDSCNNLPMFWFSNRLFGDVCRGL